MRVMFSVLLLALVAIASPAFAEIGPNCGLPFCDIAKALTQFQTLNAQDQYESLKRATVSANKATAPDVLKNINEFAAGAKTLLAQAKAERLLTDAVNQINTICITRLARYSELNAAVLIDLFKQINLEANRFEVLLAWSTRIKEVEDRAALLELSSFFSQAAAQCAAMEDEEYVVTLAKLSEQGAAKKLGKLQPMFEGVYNAEVACEGKAVCPEASIDHLVVMDTLFADNLEITLVASKVQTYVYRFSNVTVLNGGKTIEGLSVTAVGAIAKLHLDYDSANTTLIGYVDTVDFKLAINSVQDPNASLIALFDRQYNNPIPAPILPALFEGTFKGLFAGKAAALKVSFFEEDPVTKHDEAVGATLTLSEISRYKLRFHNGRFFPKTGVLLLVATSPGGGMLKVGLSIRPVQGGGYELKGFCYSSENAQVNPISLTLDAAQGVQP